MLHDPEETDRHAVRCRSAHYPVVCRNHGTLQKTDGNSGDSADLTAKDEREGTEIICAIMEPESYQDVLARPEYWNDAPHRWKNNKRTTDWLDRISSGPARPGGPPLQAIGHTHHRSHPQDSR